MRRTSNCGWVFLALLPLAVAPALASQRASVPSGTEVKVRIDKPLDTGTAKAGDTFTGTLSQAVTSGGRTIYPRGARIVGRVTNAVSSGRLKKPASITMELTTVSTQPLRIDGKSHLVRNAEMIGGGAGVGALIGALVGGKKGAAVGAGVGAGAGTAGAYMTGKKEIVLPAETELTFVAGTAATATTARAPAPQQTTRTSRTGQPQPAAYPTYPGGQGSQPASQAGYAPLAFSSRDQQLIRSFYAGSTSNLPPGLAKRHGNLPPGLERQLERNGTLPPGLQKRVEPFPSELSTQLAPLPTGYSRVILAGKALLLDRNNRILDIVALAR